jgi:hypothetical protein
MKRPKKFDVLVERVNTFLSDQQNVESLWRYILEQQHAMERTNERLDSQKYIQQKRKYQTEL